MLFYLVLACGEKQVEQDSEWESEELSVYCYGDSSQNLIEDDGDCDGVLTEDDCDDSNSSSTIIVNDGDCDGINAVDDCNDADISLGAVAEDQDCDGTLTSDDCDDFEPNDAHLYGDCDQDGVASEDDCNDYDPNFTSISGDQDCDGILASDDCDDTDASLGAIAEDGDCDGILTVDDCDDFDAMISFALNDHDCDGIPVYHDCDDTDANNTNRTSYQIRIQMTWSSSVWSSYLYDIDGKILRYETNRGVTDYTYDSNENLVLIEEVSPSTDGFAETSYTYDAGGCQIYEEYNSEHYDSDYGTYVYDSRVSNSSCDQYGNVIYLETDWDVDGVTDLTTLYTYDTEHKLIVEENDHNTYYFRYDKQGQQALKETDYNNDGSMNSWKFYFPDIIGNSIMVWSTGDATYTTDADGNIDSITSGVSYGNPRTRNMTYNENGHVIRMEEYEGTVFRGVSDYQYDQYGHRLGSYTYEVTQFDCP